MGLRAAHAGMKMTNFMTLNPPDQGEVSWGSSPLAIFTTDYIGGAGRKDFFNGPLDSKRRPAP
jgi:hypothetical protein